MDDNQGLGKVGLENSSSLREKVIPFIPMFTAYEKALIDWFGVIKVPRENRYLNFRVEYAGGEKAVKAILALKGEEARNDRARQPAITIRMVDIKYNMERYHPPESYIGVLYDGPKHLARRAARISKPSPWKVTYDIQLYSTFEIDLRYAIGQILPRFHRFGGMTYLKAAYPIAGLDPHAPKGEVFPIKLASYTHAVENGDADRVCKASMVFELDAYIPLPFQYVPTFRKLYLNYLMKGQAVDGESVLINPSGTPTLLDGGVHDIPADLLKPGLIARTKVNTYYQLQSDKVTWAVVGMQNPHGHGPLVVGSSILDSVKASDGTTRWVVEFRKGNLVQSFVVLGTQNGGVPYDMGEAALQAGSGNFDVSYSVVLEGDLLRLRAQAGSTGWTVAWERLSSVSFQAVEAESEAESQPSASAGKPITWKVVGAHNPHGQGPLLVGSSVLDSVEASAGTTRWMVEFRKGATVQSFVIVGVESGGIPYDVTGGSLQAGTGTFDVSYSVVSEGNLLRLRAEASSPGWTVSWDRLSSDS